MSPKARLNRAMREARAMFTRKAGKPPRPATSLHVEGGADFAVSVSRAERYIKISTGVVDQLDELWSRLWQTGLLTGARGGGSATDHADLSLTWLLLHELIHVRLEHHRLGSNARLVEVGTPDELLLEPTPALSASLASEDRSRLSRCLELQADDDATRAFLDEHTVGGAGEFRARVVAIFAIMALIERENARLGNRNITHPAAVTRLFMLLASVMTIWGDGEADRDIRDDGHVYIPGSALPDDRFEAYLETVFRPLMDDVTLVASAAGAVSFIDDLDDRGVLLRDINTALSEPELSPDRFTTHAAKEWLDLAPLNLKILRFLGYI